MRLKPEVKTAWLDALRSGEYTEGVGVLRDAEGAYCCLGVRCELAVAAGVLPAATQSGPGADYVYGSDSDAFPPETERGWAWVGYEDETSLEVLAIEEELANMNDAGKSFAEIADYIEQEF